MGDQARPSSEAAGPSPPQLNLPKGGGAIHGIGEKFAAHAATGTGTMSIPIAVSPGRSGFGPHLSLNYDSGAGNGSFGFGWSIGSPSIHRKTDKGLPRYDDAAESDTFILLGTEDLVPLLKADGTRVVDTTTDPNYTIYRYRPRVEAQFDRVERWTHNATRDTHWRTLSRENVLTIYGQDSNSRVTDPHSGTRVFSWLVAETRDDKGNAIVFDYKVEDGIGLDFAQINERNRGTSTDGRRKVQRYLKSIRYGNRKSLLDSTGARPRFLSDADRVNADWMFQIVLDYGEHDPKAPRPDDTGAWLCRHDPFSSYRAGFEVRSYRLCQRILMFHHFPADLAIGVDCLVRSTDLTYRSNRGVSDDVTRGNPGGSFIASVTQCGYVRSASAYLQRALPRLEFDYSEAHVDEQVRSLDPDSLAQMPVGLDTHGYRWVDLDGEGISGILTEQGGSWSFKRNRGEGLFGAAVPVACRPATAALAGNRQELLDLDGDGRLALAEFSGVGVGFFERTQDEDWEPFRAFRYLPNIPWHEPNLKFVDLDGDGMADVLITEQDVFTWYPSLGSDGFGPASRVQHVADEERGPHVLLSDGTQTIFLARMSGDGLDLVRIRSGEICYWPHLGYGRFGAKVSMDNAPRFDRLNQFDGSRIRLADLDGSGTTDIVYLGSEGVDLYFNLCGNQWSAPRRLAHFPRVDSVGAISVIDLLGRGTICLVWSTPLPDGSRGPLRYIDLMGEKPYLLTRCINNLGTETTIRYASSTRFYLNDRYYGTPWVTRLPFPVHVVERVETNDRVSRNRFVSRYVYHHGHFDGIEREFRGFGMVEQFDTEELGANATDGKLQDAVNIEVDSYVPPVHTKTWFHTGAFFGENRISRQYVSEYYREGDPLTSAGELTDAQFGASLLEDSVLDPGLSAEEMREACRALRGHILRQEIYAADNTEAMARPYSVSERNYTIHLLQGFGPNLHAAYLPHARETIDSHYERALYKVGGQMVSDPRVSHSVVLSIDSYGNELLSAAIAYGRRHDDPDPLLTSDDRSRQRQIHVTATESSYTNAIDTSESYRAPLAADVQTFEIIKPGKPTPSASPTPTYSFGDLGALLQQAADGLHDLPYEDLDATGATQNAPYRRLIERVRHVYRADDLKALLPLGTLQALGLAGASYKQAFTTGLLDGCFHRANGAVTETLVPSAATTLGGKAGDAGGYVSLNPGGGWWISGSRVFYHDTVDIGAPASTAPAELSQARLHFFMPRAFADPFDNVTTVEYDVHDLLVSETRDPMQNLMIAVNDYRVLQPARVTESNGNRSEVAFDAIGLVVGTAVKGKATESLGDSLDGFVADLTTTDIAKFFGDPRGAPAGDLLKQATSRIVYDLDRYANSGAAALPVYAATIARETHASEPGGGSSSLQTNFSYSDGMGREIQKKAQAEDGSVVEGGSTVSPRWVASGWVIYNNKGKPARQYEPFFDDTHEFKFGNKVGVSRVLFYDPPGRVVATLHPNRTWEKVVFDPWRQTTWDVNDTVAITDATQDLDVGQYFSRLPGMDFTQTWYAARIGGALGSQERSAATKAFEHAGTPAVACFDTLGRTFLTIADNGQDSLNTPQKYVSRNDLDIEGNVRKVRDALGRIVMLYDYDMLGTRTHQSSMEAGERWMLKDVTGNVIRSWDSRRHTFRILYDAIRRPAETYLIDDVNSEMLIGRTVYGETVSNPEVSNLRGKIYQQFDQAGIVTNRVYDFKGNLQSTSRQFAVEYRKALDWASAVGLSGETHDSITLHDAFNRPIAITTPESSVIRPSYNEANLLEKVDVNLRGTQQSGQPVWTSFVKNIDYDEKGQRKRIQYGNGAGTNYDYDTETFRLTHVVTKRGGETLQDLRYTYDPAGNIIHIEDAAQETIFFRQKMVEPSNDYTYDPLYRLTQAKGREHLGQSGGKPFSPMAYGADDSSWRSPDHPGDGTAMGTYTETYLYDAAGNLLNLGHAGDDPPNSGWNRIYTYSEPSLIEPALMSNRLSNTKVGTATEACKYEGSAGLHGNMTFMPHLQVMQWDFRDQLQATATQKVNSGTPETTWYVYDTAGQRVRKITDSVATGADAPRRRKERIYLGPLEMYREYDSSDGSVSFERETLHVMDDKRRIAIVETRTKGSDDGPGRLTRYQCGNHLGSATLELDDAANVISYEEYFPYGSTSYQAVDKSMKAAAKRYRFTGMERDEENGFNYHSARYYACWLGRWTSSDPAGLADGLDTYLYSQCCPIGRSDAGGTQSEPSLPDVNPSPAGVSASFSFDLAPPRVDRPRFNFNSRVEKPASDGSGEGEWLPLGETGRKYRLSVGVVNDQPSPPSRNLWNRGGGTLLGGAISLGLGVAVLSNPVGWFGGLAAALSIAGGVVGTSLGSVQLALSYSGNTTMAQDTEASRAVGLSMMLSGPGGLALGTIGAGIAGERGLERGALIGNLAEAGATLAYAGGRMLLRELEFGKQAQSSWRAVRPTLQGMFGGSASRLNAAFPRGRELMELSHFVPQRWFRGTFGEWIFNRPWNLRAMWGGEHALVDASRLQFLKQPFRAAYEAEQLGGIARHLKLAPNWMLEMEYGFARGSGAALDSAIGR